MLSEGSSVKGSPEDKQPSGPYIKGSAKISRRVTLALYTGNDGFLYYAMNCTHYTGTGSGNDCFLLCQSRSLS